MKLAYNTLCFIGGMLFAIAWWIFADAAQEHRNNSGSVDFVHMLPGFTCSLHLILFNLVDWNKMKGEDALDPGTSNRAKLMFGFSSLVGLLGFAGSIILNVVKPSFLNFSWYGTAILINSLLIIVSSVVLRSRHAGAEE